jgi:hypothetical protein
MGAMALIDSHGKPVQVCGLAVLILAAILAAVSAQSDDVTTGNGFTPDQEVRLGRESAAVVRRLLPLLRVRRIDSFVRDIGRSLVDRLPAHLRQSRFRYSFDVLNVTDLLSYALPGGPIFVSRGMIEAAPTEAVLAGLLAHQVSHVALRHGAIQRTRGEMFEPADLSEQVLGGITLRTDDEPPFLGSNFSITGYFLNYNAALEREAELLSAQLLTRAGYDLRDMTAMFRAIVRTAADRGETEWIERHPDADLGDRDADTVVDINDPADAPPMATASPTGRFESIRARLRAMAPARTATEAARAQARRLPEGSVGLLGIVVPSGQSRRVLVGNVLEMEVPSNWRRLSGKSSVAFAPVGASVASDDGTTTFTHGIQVGVALSSTKDLAGDIFALLERFTRTHPRTQWAPVYQRTSFGGQPGLTSIASTVSDVSGRFEYVSVSAAHLRDGRLLYIIGIAPQPEAGTYRGAFTRIRRSIRVFD